MSGVSVLDKKLFHFSEKGIHKSVEELKENLCILISQLRKDTTSSFPINSNPSLPSILATNKFEGEKCRLKKLLDLEKKKLDVSSPKAKRKKSSQIQSLPDISSPSDLIGKRVEHFTFDSSGKQKWYDGWVVCLKPSDDSELVMRYSCEDKLYSLPFEDFNFGLLKLKPLTADFLTGKKIRQKFENALTGVWWETGLIIDSSFDKESLNCTVNFYDYDSNLDEVDDIEPYEMLSYAILEDYLNHDFLLV